MRGRGGEWAEGELDCRICRMSKHSLLSNLSQYFGARFAAMMLGLFPIEQNLESARGIGEWMYKLDRKHRKRAAGEFAGEFS